MQKRIRDYGVEIGMLKTGPLNKISDVAGVRVGHVTLDDGDTKTGVTAIMPTLDNVFINKLTAASYVINGHGKTIGLVQLDELGTLESPILLTNTLNVGLVSDALVEFTIKRCQTENQECLSFNPVVAECNDSFLNNIQARAVKEHHVFQAISQAIEDFEEGDVGAGKGMSCHQLKSGIGSASRVLNFEGKDYTIGVLVLANHGVMEDLTINGEKIGQQIKQAIEIEKSEDKGSIIVVFATDLPLSDRQLKRVCKRATVGISRVGSYIGHGSGDLVIGFSTVNGQNPSDKTFETMTRFKESALESVFRAMAEATEESILNALMTSSKVVGYQGHVRRALKDYYNI